MSSKNNLHREKVILAMQHIPLINQALDSLEKDKSEWWDVWNAIYFEKVKLLENNPAYQEAVWRLEVGHTVDIDEDNIHYKIYDRNGNPI